ncbi:glutaminyl-peptide cyclotransferase [Tenacibaculum sp. UWU-22]|uniref:glutaminyl-peptide cyclotransferase n=1 Tax=Tenacibaculum sp. UWU-22 TaxID=3234187 RepID=UPI0034DB4928
MRIYNLCVALLIATIITSCKTEYKFKLTTTKKVTLGEKAQASLVEENGVSIDSVKFFFNGKPIISNGNTAEINTANFGVGKYSITAIAFYPNKAKKINNSIEIVANKAPTVYTYKIVNSYPHDTKAYTQGLEYKDGFLYETTGRRGQSSLRKVVIKTGKVLQKEDLDSRYFGEGMTIFNNKIYWLTWQAGKGFVYDFNTFKQEKEFPYQKSIEGWGLTHNDTELIKSDGTNKIWFLDPETLKEKRAIQVYTNKYSIAELNELELINGKIYANKWQQNAIVIIDPATGVVEGVADLSGLKKLVKQTQKLEPQDDVLNGIAYDSANNRLFVTGKHWNTLFEIELLKK